MPPAGISITTTTFCENRFTISQSITENVGKISN